jgi:hypothetical protein
MGLTTRIIYAAHARGTHHKLALDSLAHLEGPRADGWRRLFLANAAGYTTGAKAPDDEFKDFQNHVLHVRDGYWGGAADKVENWYGHLVTELKGARWKEAVWAAGVLSHYFTDPIHPFHTAQSEAENSIHRAAEWSISKSYDALRAEGAAAFAHVRPKPWTGAGWLRAFVIAGAETGNKQYEKLIAHYDINSGVVVPEEGLDAVGRRVVAELIVYATHGFAALLDRAFEEAAVEPPETSLVLPVLAALANIPRNKLKALAENAAEQRLVESMYDELKATGKVEKTLPEDERVLRDAYDREVLARALAQRDKARAETVALPPQIARHYVPRPGEKAAPPPALAASADVDAGAPVQKIEPPARAIAAPAPAPAPAASPAPAPAQDPAAGIETEAKSAEPATELPPAPASVPSVKPAVAAPPASVPTVKPATAEVIAVQFGEKDASAPRVWLQPADDVERAPSIGPKMAERLYAHGIRTVADLLAADAGKLSLDLDHRSVWEETIVDWQDQARLVCAIPGLRGTHAQLLVGAGYRARDAVAAASADKLCADVLAFAVSTEGQRVLRDGHPPDIERIKGWLESAKAAKVA